MKAKNIKLKSSSLSCNTKTTLCDSGIHYRDYQKECLLKLEEHYKTKDNGIICIPTGGGKTIIFSKFSENKNTLIISHTEELVVQAKLKYEFVNNIKCGIANSNNWDVKHIATSASIQTLHSRINTKEFEALVYDKEYFIVDEAHHFPASTYIEVYNRIKQLNPKIKLLGVTATPFRSDNQELKEHFEEMVYNIDIKNLIKNNNLVPTKAKIIRIPENIANFSNVKIRRDAFGITDYSLKSLSNVLGQDNVLENVTDSFIKEYNGRKTIFFTSSIEVSKLLVTKLISKGIKAVHIDGTMNKKDRTDIIEEYRDGIIEVLSNVNILTEGFDDPSTECIALLRPTKSLNLYAQIIGRGLRTSIETNKENCLVLDFTPATSKFSKGLANLFDLFDLEVDENSRENFEQFTINSSKGKLFVNFGTNSEELELFSNQPHLKEYLTIINEKEVLCCGAKHHLLLSKSKDENGLNQIELINTLDGKIEYIKNVPDNIVMNKLYEVWENIANKTKIDKNLMTIVSDKYIELISNKINETNKNIFNNDNYDHNDMIVDKVNELKELNYIQLTTYEKYLDYVNTFKYTLVKVKKNIICEDLSINYSNIKFENFKELLNYYKLNQLNIEFENELIEDFVKYLAPVEDDEWIPENSFITKRTKDSFTFKIMVNGVFKLHYVNYEEHRDKLLYKELINYILERIHYIRKNKSKNSKYYRVPTINYLKSIRPVTKKLNYYQDNKKFLIFK